MAECRDFLGLCLAVCCCVLAERLHFSVVTHSIGAVERATSIGDDFRSWKAQMPAIPAGRSRIVVYPGGSRSLIYSVTGVGKGRRAVLRGRPRRLRGPRQFLHLSRPAARERTRSPRKACPTCSVTRKGKNRLSVDLARAGLTYIRIDKEGEPLWHHYIPKQVDAASAEAELAKLPLYGTG